MNGFVMIVRV